MAHSSTLSPTCGLHSWANAPTESLPLSHAAPMENMQADVKTFRPFLFWVQPVDCWINVWLDPVNNSDNRGEQRSYPKSLHKPTHLSAGEAKLAQICTLSSQLN